MTVTDMSCEQRLLANLQQLRSALPDCHTLLVAYSGGLDSQVLLVILHKLMQEIRRGNLAGPVFDIRAVHVNHGLSPNADQWQAHCQQQCQQLQIPLHCDSVQLKEEGPGIEDQARRARYAVFERVLARLQSRGDDDTEQVCLFDEETAPGSRSSGIQTSEVSPVIPATPVKCCLLMAHHLDDQTETLLLRLMRGAGPRGLAAIPRDRALGQGWLWRPLLDCTRHELEGYAKARRLSWVEDESNTYTCFDRNYLRQQVSPLLHKRWPRWQQQWQRSARLCHEAAELNEELAACDLLRLKTEDPRQIKCQPLLELSELRQRNVLRHWLLQMGFPAIGWKLLHRLVQEMLPAGPGSSAEIIWKGYQLRRYRDRLYAFVAPVQVDTQQKWQWTVPSHDSLQRHCIALGDNRAVYLEPRSDSPGLLLTPGQQIEIRFRAPGETCRLVGRPSRSLKKILQEAGIPPWQRDQLPLIIMNGRLAAIPGVGICEGFQGVPGYRCISSPPGPGPDSSPVVPDDAAE